MALRARYDRRRTFEAHYSQDRAKQFFHSSSYTANPIACAAADANLAIWREEPVLDRIADLARRQTKALSRLAMLPGISNARQSGTITAIEVDVPAGGYLSDIGPKLQAFFFGRDLLLRPLGNTVYVMPPYWIDSKDLAALYAGIADSVTA